MQIYFIMYAPLYLLLVVIIIIVLKPHQSMKLSHHGIDSLIINNMAPLSFLQLHLVGLEFPKSPPGFVPLILLYIPIYIHLFRLVYPVSNPESNSFLSKGFCVTTSISVSRRIILL